MGGTWLEAPVKDMAEVVGDSSGRHNPTWDEIYLEKSRTLLAILFARSTASLTKIETCFVRAVCRWLAIAYRFEISDAAFANTPPPRRALYALLAVCSPPENSAKALAAPVGASLVVGFWVGCALRLKVTVPMACAPRLATPQTELLEAARTTDKSVALSAVCAMARVISSRTAQSKMEEAVGKTWRDPAETASHVDLAKRENMEVSG